MNRLFFSCAHLPYEHQDFLRFLKAVAKKFRVKSNGIFNLGDLLSNEGLSDHPINPDMPNQGTESDLVAKKLTSKWYPAFPELQSVASNHEKRPDKRAKKGGIPKRFIKEMGEAFEAPEGWTWHKNLIITLDKGINAFLAHTVSKDLRKAVLSTGMCVIQGHNHSEFRVSYINTPSQTGLFGANVGCGIDDSSLAMEYNKDHIARPVLGCLVTEKARPSLINMHLDKKGRWVGKL